MAAPPVGRPVRSLICEGCARAFPARQIVDGKMRSLYGRRFCLDCSAYGSRYGSRYLRAASRSRPTKGTHVIAGRDEWFFRSLHALLTLFSPASASLIARTGVAVFGVSLLLPIVISNMVARPGGQLVAATNDARSPAYELASVQVPGVAHELPRLPDLMARRPSLARATSEPTSPAVRVAAVPIPIAAVPAAASGSVVIASWYGPGFYENRLPCWPWLKAQGLPIQFLPDTWGVAHKSLPCGTMVTLTHGTNTVTVPVVDRGPYIAGRELDLSPRVKAALGCTDLCTVVMQIR